MALQLRWDHQFQFAGYYVAKWEGYYSDAGFDVEIRSAITSDGKILGPVEEVSEGRADFGVGAADILIGRERGAPLVVLGVIFQQSAAEFYALEGTRFNSPSDLLNLKVARKVDDLIDVELQAMLLAEGIDPKKIKPLPHPPGVTHLVEGRVDAIPGYRISAPHELRLQGANFKTMRPINYGIDFYGDSLFAHQRRVEEDIGSTERFLKATLKGWRYALEHPNEITERIANELPRTAKISGGNALDFNRFQIEGVKELTLYPIVEVGHTNPNRWRRMHEFLKEIGIVEKPLDIGQFVFNPVKLKLERKHRLYETIKNILFSTTAIALFVLVWSLMLKRTVLQKTRELREQEEALRKNEEQFRQVAETIREVFWLGSPDWKEIYYISPAYEQVWGKQCTELHENPMSWFESVMEEDRPKVMAAIPKEMTEGVKEVIFPDYRIIRPDGAVTWISARAFPVLDSSGRIHRVAGIAEGITERKSAEEALAKSEAFLKTIYTDSEVALFVVKVTEDRDYVYEGINACHEKLIGVPAPWVIGKRPKDLRPHIEQETIDLVYRLYDQCVETRQFVRIEHPAVLGGRETWWISTVKPLVDQNDTVYRLIGTAIPITDRKLAENKLKEYSERLEEMVEERTAELRKTQEELLLKERLAVLGHFAGNISHEIRNPLAVIDASVYFLKMKLKGKDEKADPHFERIASNIKQATTIIESLLNLTRMEKPKTKPCGLRELVSGIMASARIPKTIAIERDFPDNGVLVNVDADQIRMALRNIIKNAIQAMDEVGTIRVSIYTSGTERVEIAISDTGPGIPPETVEKVFEPLFTTKARGIGFGLSIAKMIVENHGGTVRAESEPGRGAAFVFTLPGT